MPIPKFPNAYEINISKKGNTLEFTTDRNLTYEIYTQPGTKVIPGFVFSSSMIYFGFYTKHTPVADPKVMQTIINFMIDVLEDPNAIVAYIYSSANQQEKARERHFNSLFLRYYAQQIYKTDFRFSEKDGTATILFRPGNVNIEALKALTAEQILERIAIKEQFDDFYL